MGEVTHILSRIEAGDAGSADQLLPLIYDELRKLAAARLSTESEEQLLEATALVHEAYLRLVGNESVVHWDSRGHFFAAAAEAMRRILVDQARQRKSLKRGGGHARVELSEISSQWTLSDEELLALDAALEKLHRLDERKARVVHLRYFAGLTIEQAAKALQVSTTTVENDWTFARCWLRAEIGDA